MSLISGLLNVKCLWTIHMGVLCLNKSAGYASLKLSVLPWASSVWDSCGHSMLYSVCFWNMN